MRNYLLVALATTALVGCATTPVPITAAKQAPSDRLLAFQDKPTGPSGTITVIRDDGLIGGGCYQAVSINGKTAARLDVGEKSTFFVSPGEVLLRAGRDPQGKGLCSIGQDDWTQRETLIKQDEHKYFRMSIDTSGKNDIQRVEP